ncbi:MAG: hypothetical protein KJ774_11025 [Firmicutes bacterium]|nr:hypothetical protein [Bacillota bacterium]
MKNQDISYPFTGIVGQTKVIEDHEYVLSIDEVSLFREQTDKNVLEVADLFNSERRMP